MIALSNYPITISQLLNNLSALVALMDFQFSTSVFWSYAENIKHVMWMKQNGSGRKLNEIKHYTKDKI